jgi:hypothetical protein
MNAPFSPGVGHNGGPPMMSSPFYVTDAEQFVWNFFVSQIATIETQVYKIQYPDVRYPDLIPVDTSGDPWTQVVTYFSQDRIGAADWFHANAQDVPMVEHTRNQFSVPVQMAAIGFGYNDEELAVAARLGINLTADKANSARRAAEEFIDKIALFGDTRSGFLGLFNQTSVTTSAAAATGTASSTLWSDKTPDNVIADINSAITGIYTTSLQIETADTILLPLLHHTALATRRLDPTQTTTLLEHVMRVNAYTLETGRPLTIRAVRGLETAGSASAARMVVYRKAPEVLKMHMPMPFEFLPPWRKGPMRYEVPGRFRLGGVDVRRPGAVRYVDGI